MTVRYCLAIVTLACACSSPANPTTSTPLTDAQPAAHTLTAPLALAVTGGPCFTYTWSHTKPVRVTITNATGCTPTTFVLAVFRTFTPFSLDNQKLYSLADVTVAPGETKVLLAAAMPECSKWQADLFDGIVKADVESGRVSIHPRTGKVPASYHFGRHDCEEPPTVPPVVVPPVVPPSVPPVTPPQGPPSQPPSAPPTTPPQQPPSTACAGPWRYSGANPFTLPNSGNATELAHVQAYVSPLLTGPVKTNLSTTTWTSDGAYPVVIVKAAQVYFLHTNVTLGQVLISPATNQNGQVQAISHVSRFQCP